MCRPLSLVFVDNDVLAVLDKVEHLRKMCFELTNRHSMHIDNLLFFEHYPEFVTCCLKLKGSDPFLVRSERESSGLLLINL